MIGFPKNSVMNNASYLSDSLNEMLKENHINFFDTAMATARQLAQF